MNLKHIKDWDPILNEGEFFLSLDDPSNKIYLPQRSRKKTKDSAEVLDPIEQLSPKGLALLSAIFAEKEKHPGQALIATSMKDVLHVVSLMQDAAPGTKVPIILQPLDGDDSIKFHKTVIFLERGEKNVLNVIFIDSVADENRFMSTFSSTFQENEIDLELKAFHPKKPYYPEFGVSITRQQDPYQCGVFAIKDARMLMTQPEVFEHIKQSNTDRFELPTQALKSVESKRDIKLASESHGEKTANREGKTLNWVYDKYKSTEAGYVSHFSQKYHDQVQNHLKGHSPDEIRCATNLYDAGQLTKERLKEAYAPDEKNKLKF